MRGPATGSRSGGALGSAEWYRQIASASLPTEAIESNVARIVALTITEPARATIRPALRARSQVHSASRVHACAQHGDRNVESHPGGAARAELCATGGDAAACVVQRSAKVQSDLCTTFSIRVEGRHPGHTKNDWCRSSNP